MKYIEIDYSFFEINVTRPKSFYGATGLTTVSTIGNVDQFTTENYMDLVDAPIMYNVPEPQARRISWFVMINGESVFSQSFN